MLQGFPNPFGGDIQKDERYAHSYTGGSPRRKMQSQVDNRYPGLVKSDFLTSFLFSKILSFHHFLHDTVQILLFGSYWPL